jgi:hypothetical protein
MVMLFNATFNNISVILQWSVLLVDETGVVATERCKSNYHTIRLLNLLNTGYYENIYHQ